MSHDDSFVARIEFNHDVVRDCPDPSKSMNVGATTGAGSASREIEVEEVSLQNIFVDSAYNAMLSNTTKSVLASNISCAYGNTFAKAGMVPGGYCRKRDKGRSK